MEDSKLSILRRLFSNIKEIIILIAGEINWITFKFGWSVAMEYHTSIKTEKTYVNKKPANEELL